MNKVSLLPAEKARETLCRQGLSIAAFARLHGLNERLVRGVIDGRYSCRFGKSHKAAVLLGIKEGEITCTAQAQ